MVRIEVFKLDYDHEDGLFAFIHDLRSVADMIPVQWRGDARVKIDAVGGFIAPLPRITVYYDRPKTQLELDTDAAIAQMNVDHKAEKERKEYLRLKAIYGVDT